MIYASFLLALHFLSHGPSHCYLRSSHPSPSGSVHVFFGPLPWNILQNGMTTDSQDLSAAVVVIVAEIAPNKVKLLENTIVCHYTLASYYSRGLSKPTSSKGK